MLFSILIANFNNGYFFKDCYESILNQTYQNWEVIIVDDCSTDDSVEIIKTLTQNDQRFFLNVSAKNEGCGYTKRRCAALARGEILGFLDSDDVLIPTALESMVGEHKKNPEASIISSQYEVMDVKMKKIREENHGSEIPENQSYLTHGMGAITHFATFKKEAYINSGGINPDMKRAVDQDLYYKLEEQGRHVHINEILYRYRIHQNNISLNKNLYKARHWHFIAKVAAYKRRKKSYPHIPNFSRSQYKRLKSTYYLYRFKRIKDSKREGSKFYFLFKSILVNPFHMVQLKLKALFFLVFRI